jgi:hypothetical protein
MCVSTMPVSLWLKRIFYFLQKNKISYKRITFLSIASLEFSSMPLAIKSLMNKNHKNQWNDHPDESRIF